MMTPLGPSKLQQYLQNRSFTQTAIGSLNINTAFASTLTKVLPGLASVFFIYDLISDMVEGRTLAPFHIGGVCFCSNRFIRNDFTG